MRCCKCGKDIAMDANFCGYCGSVQITEVKHCTNCGALLRVHYSQCLICGEPVNCESSVSWLKKTMKPLRQVYKRFIGRQHGALMLKKTQE